jgi:hypothetical protein
MISLFSLAINSKKEDATGECFLPFNQINRHVVLIGNMLVIEILYYDSIVLLKQRING